MAVFEVINELTLRITFDSRETVHAKTRAFHLL